MEKPILIIVTIVVLLLVGIIVLAFFTGGLQNFQNIFTDWSGSATDKARCQADCAQACLGEQLGNEPTKGIDVASCEEKNVGFCVCTKTGSTITDVPGTVPG